MVQFTPVRLQEKLGPEEETLMYGLELAPRVDLVRHGNVLLERVLVAVDVKVPRAGPVDAEAKPIMSPIEPCSPTKQNRSTSGRASAHSRDTSPSTWRLGLVTGHRVSNPDPIFGALAQRRGHS
jgi:hypothetical protein